jgi:hypothetical protein
MRGELSRLRFLSDSEEFDRLPGVHGPLQPVWILALPVPALAERIAVQRACSGSLGGGLRDKRGHGWRGLRRRLMPGVDGNMIKAPGGDKIVERQGMTVHLLADPRHRSEFG